MNKKNFLISICIYFMILMYFIISKRNNLLYIQSLNYDIIVIVYSIIGSINIYIYNKYKIYIFEPLNLINFIYFMMFIYYPLRDINIDRTLYFGMSVDNGALRATIIFFISYLFYIIGYFYKKKNHIFSKIIIYRENLNKNILYISLIIWFIGFLANLFYLMKGGLNLSYIFSLGQIGNVDIERSSGKSIVGFIGMFGFMMVSSNFYIWRYSKKKYISYLTYGITFIFFVLRGFRFILVIIIMSPLIYYYLRENKKPKIKMIVFLIVILLVMVVSLRVYRNDLRKGTTTVNIEEVMKDNIIDESLYDNFSMYKTFYITVEKIPKNLPYSYGVNLLINPLIMIIPRIIWKEKKFFGDEVYYNLFPDYAYSAGATAACNLGEAYRDFGIIGCILFQYIFGVISAKMKRSYLNKNINFNSLVKYSIFVPLTLQIVIRGYMASNLYLIIFLFLPVWILEKLFPTSDKN